MGFGNLFQSSGSGKITTPRSMKPGSIGPGSMDTPASFEEVDSRRRLPPMRSLVDPERNGSTTGTTDTSETGKYEFNEKPLAQPQLPETGVNEIRQPVEPMRPGRGRAAFLVATASMTYSLHGMGNSVTNGILTLNLFLQQFPMVDTQYTVGKQKSENSTIQGIMVGSYLIGCALGAITCYFVTGRFGRKRVIQVLGAFNMVGVILQTSAFTLEHLIIGRFVTGIGIGAGHATFPLYLSECVKPQARGRAIFCCAAACNLMHLVGAAIMVAFYFVTTSSMQWRFPLALELLVAIPSAVMPYWITETPRWLLAKGRWEGALKSYAQLSGRSVHDPQTVIELEEIQIAMQQAHIDSLEGQALPAPKRHWRAFMAIVIQIMASMSGIDVISYYSTVIFEDQLHYSNLMARYLTTGLQGCQFVASTTALFLIDYLGRRPLLLTAAVMMAIAMGFLWGLLNPSASHPMLQASVAFQFLTMISYPIGFHLIPAMFSAELSPGAQRHQITAIAGCIHWLFNFMVSMVSPVAFDSIQSRYYLVYFSANIFTFICVLLLYPETKGLSLETIDHIFEHSRTYFDVPRMGRKIFQEEQRAARKRQGMEITPTSSASTKEYRISVSALGHSAHSGHLSEHSQRSSIHSEHPSVHSSAHTVLNEPYSTQSSLGKSFLGHPITDQSSFEQHTGDTLSRYTGESFSREPHTSESHIVGSYARIAELPGIPSASKPIATPS